MKKDTYKGFFAGIVFMLCLVIGLGTVGAAASKIVNIKVLQGGITIYVDEKIVKPTDVNGNVVEPFVYNGTTYLPVRAISNALGKEVTWDGGTSSIYVGKAPGATQTDITTLKLFDSSWNSEISSGKKAEFPLLDKTITPFNLFINYRDTEPGYATYIIDSKYSKLKADFALSSTSLSSDEGWVKFYNVEPNGTKHLIEEYRATLNDGSIPVNVNLAGVNILQIELSAASYSLSPVIYNMVLEGIK